MMSNSGKILNISIFRRYILRNLDVNASYSPLIRKACMLRLASTSSPNAVEDKPLPFSTSKAASWKAKYSLENVEDDSPKSQPFVMMFSIAAILIYFCILREENDIDELLSNEDAWKAVPGLEKRVLETAIQEYSKRGEDTSELERALSNIK